MAWLPFAIQAGAGLLGSWLGGRKSAEEQWGVDTTKQLTGQQADLAKQRAGQAGQFWGQAGLGGQSLLNYYMPIVGGSRTAAMSAMAPEIGRATQGIDAAHQTGMNLGARSGTAASYDPYAKTRAVTTMLQMARPQAAQGLGQTASLFGQWGSAGDQASRGFFGGALSGIQSLFDWANQQRQRQTQGAQAGWGAAGDLLKRTGWFGGNADYSNAAPAPNVPWNLGTQGTGVPGW